MRDPGKVLKAEKWWNNKGTPVLGVAYFLLAEGYHTVPLLQAVETMAAFIAAFVGVAGFGHVVNDLCDLELDRKSQKSNSMEGRSRWQIAALILALLALSWSPWLVLPANGWNLRFIGLQLLLLTIYAAPPLRLKARPVPGVITDALYAYTVPVLITWTTWSYLTPMAPRPYVLAALVMWSVFAGLKGILNHQYQDAEGDAAFGVETFATRYGRRQTLWLLARAVVPAEAACFALMTAALASEYPLYLGGVTLYLCWRCFQLAWMWDEPVDVPWRLSSEQSVTLYGYQLLGEFYVGWFPVFMLVALCYRSPAYLLLAAAHLALFRTGVRELVTRDFKDIPWGIAKLRKRHV
jgi:4-hydroxybenzoate polyprenyltransferase